MRLSQKMMQVSAVLAIWGGVALAAGPSLAFRAPLETAGNFKVPEYIVGARPERSEEAFRERLSRMSLYLGERKVGDMEMFGQLRSNTNLKFDGEKVTAFQKEFESFNKRIEETLANKSNLKPEEVYNRAVELLAAREKAYAKFLGENKGATEFHIRPGEVKSVEDWGNVLVFAKGAEGVARGAEGQPEMSNTGDHGGAAASRTSNVEASNDRAVGNLWNAGKACGGLCGRLDAQLGAGSPMSKATIARVNKVLEQFSRQGNSVPATNFLAKINEVVDAMEKLPGASKTALRDVLVELLKSRGISDTTFDELTAFAKGGDVDALQGMHRMALVLRKLREKYAADNKPPKEGTAAYEEWLAKRDEWVGTKLQDWVDYGEAFRESVAKKEGKDGFDAWMSGKHSHEAEGRDKAERPERALGEAFCGNCGGWMRKACPIGGAAAGA